MQVPESRVRHSTFCFLRCHPDLTATRTLERNAGHLGKEVLLVALTSSLMRSLPPPLSLSPTVCKQSRVFAILDARRPEMGSDLGNKIMVETKRPSWTPPGFVFPIVWTTIGILRTVSSMLVWEACSCQYLATPNACLETSGSVSQLTSCLL